MANSVAAKLRILITRNPGSKPGVRYDEYAFTYHSICEVYKPIRFSIREGDIGDCRCVTRPPGKLQAAAPEDLQKYRGDVIVHYVGRMSVYY